MDPPHLARCGQKDSVLLSGEAEEGTAQADGTEKALTESKDKDA